MPTVHRNWLGAVAGLALGVLAVGMVVVMLSTLQLAGEVRDTQIEGTPLGKKLLDSAESIESCTTPGKACFRRGQRQTADAVGDISMQQVAAVACADQPGTQTPLEIKACVDRTMRVFRATKH